MTAFAAGLALFASGLVACTLRLTVGDGANPAGLSTTPSTSASSSASPSVSPSRPGSVSRTNAAGFAHPGVLVSSEQLDFVRDRLRRDLEPWTTAFAEMEASRYAALTWQPRPRAVVECGGNSIPNNGCEDESSDAVAAYTHALMWYLTRKKEHAGKAIEIIDAWSGVLSRHTNSNAQIQAGWSGASFVRAAELIRHTYGGWPVDRVTRAETMFRNAFVPVVGQGAPDSGGNWELVALDAATSIAVFLEDRALFNRAISRFRARVPAFIYLAGDGPLPRSPTGQARSRPSTVEFWYGQRSFVDGLTQETCRDFGHTAWGLSAAAHIAETARLQGIDIFGDIRQRMVAALEFHAQYEGGQPIPGWLCGGRVQRGFRPIPEVAYHHYAVRMGISLPLTERFLQSKRPEGAAHFYGWETLTHANNAY